jgi:hypothetical protein
MQTNIIEAVLQATKKVRDSRRLDD